MAVLAVIPACEGSSKLPNKNLRLIDGKPLIYYPIKAALQCNAVDSVLVTTNSEEIVTIAHKMGVSAFKRAPELCSEEVSLDAVIYDAVQHISLQDDDYVVTVQSVCPTISPEVLENAIAKCREDGLDTLISVVKKQQFFWRYENGAPHPFYSERINRHKLEPLYVETGAFFITKARFVQADSRIGPRVELMEVIDGDAVDIDVFGDLKQAESIIRRKKIAFFVNGNNTIGLGHVYRVLQIADELSDRPDIYYDRSVTDRQVFGDTKHKLIGVDGVQGLIWALAENKYDLLINDILSTDTEYMQSLRRAAPDTKLLNFEDDSSGAELADGVVNALYEESCCSNACCGSRYYVIPKLFLLYKPIEIAPEVRNVLISFGGADPCSYTELLLKTVEKEAFSQCQFHVVLGRAKNNVRSIFEYQKYPNIHIYHDIKDMPQLMSECDIAVTSRGRTAFELAAMGIPSISIPQNEREARHDFACEKNGFMCLPQYPAESQIEKQLLEYINMSQEDRVALQQKMLSNDLRNGRKNILALIDTITNKEF